MKAEFYYNQRRYECSVVSLSIEQENVKELRIRNHEGEILAIQQGQKTALRGKTRATSQLDFGQS
jgi:Na+-transporting NADH:ubiquinone oxidoreductase subunit NqrF